MDIQIICDIIILAGALAAAIYNILKLFSRPRDFFKKRKNKEVEELLEKSIDNILPKYINPMSNEINNIKNLNEEQLKTINLLGNNVRDILRQKIECIYYLYKNEKAIPQYQLENLEELYSDYKELNGNHHIDKLYNRMKSWTITNELPEYDKD